MFYKINTLLMIMLFGNSFAEDCDRSKCPGDQKLYKELNCKPIYKDGQCCAVRYECQDLTTLDREKCHFNGNQYDINEAVPQNETEKYCVPSCNCHKFSEHPKFTCSHYDCAEFFGPRNSDCILTYGIDSCCSTGKVCGDDKKKLAKCHVDDEEYLEGQSIYPKSEPCYKCLCQAGFDNSTIVGNSNCKEIKCGMMLHYHDRLLRGCAPIYFGNNKCCPIPEFRCPDAGKDEIISTGRSENSDFCNFGDLKVFVGDDLKSSDNTVKCSCVTPPHIQCIKEQND